MCGSGPHERDAKGNIDFEKEDRTRIAEVIDFLDPNFKKVISNGNFPIRDHCFGGFLNVTAAQCGDSINNIQPFFGGGFAERGSQKDVFIFNGSKTKTTMKFCRSEAACAKIKGDGYWIFGGSVKMIWFCLVLTKSCTLKVSRDFKTFLLSLMRFTRL